jgi:phosphate transport system substrate-binding protein
MRTQIGRSACVTPARHLLWAAAVVLLCQGCGSSDLVTLHGAGATFPEPIYKRWFREYYDRNSKVRVSYQGIGSGAGIKQFSQGLVDFGASDSAMTAEEIRQVPDWGVQLLPMTSGCVVLAYNLPGVKERIRLPREVYTRIFLGTATEWNDPAIVRANPGSTCPSCRSRWCGGRTVAGRPSS